MPKKIELQITNYERDLLTQLCHVFGDKPAREVVGYLIRKAAEEIAAEIQRRNLSANIPPAPDADAAAPATSEGAAAEAPAA